MDVAIEIAAGMTRDQKDHEDNHCHTRHLENNSKLIVMVVESALPTDIVRGRQK